MKITDTQPRVLAHIEIDVTFQDLASKIKTSGTRPEIADTAKRTLDKVKTMWQPAAVYRWVEFQQNQTDTMGRIIPNSDSPVDIDFGYSIRFLRHATHALVSVYTAGRELEQASKKAVGEGEFLEAYFLDIIGLIVLDKAGDRIRQFAEQKAAESGWGVGPFLSPGSVHGWELENQTELCTLLPLEKIDVSIQDNAVLSPFTTVSCLIGLGDGYDEVKVGSACQVCSKNHDCQMKLH